MANWFCSVFNVVCRKRLASHAVDRTLRGLSSSLDKKDNKNHPRIWSDGKRKKWPWYKTATEKMAIEEMATEEMATLMEKIDTKNVCVLCV